MSLAGPRLDRPSAVGDEGRPRAASLTVASVVVVALVGGGGVLLGQSNLVFVLGMLAGMTAAGMALLDRERFVHLVAGHCFLAWFGVPLTLLVVGAPFVGRSGFAVSGFALALLALAATWTDAGNRDGLTRTVKGSALTYIGMIFWLVALTVVGGIVAVGWLFFSALTGQSAPAASTVGFLFVLASTVGTVLLALRWLPIRQLTPRRHRETVAERIAAVRRVALAIGAVATVLLLAAGLGWALGGFALLSDLAPAVVGALGVLSSPLLLGPVAVVGTTGLLVGLVALTLRGLTRRFDPTSASRLAAVVAGLSLAVIVVAGLVLATAAPIRGLFVVFGAFVGPMLLLFAAGTSLVGIAVGVLPDRAWGPALTAAGLILAAIGVAGAQAPLAFACVAAALLVWDLSTFGLGLTAELGHLPETRRLELFHGVLAVGVALLAVLAATGLDFLRTSVFAGVGGAPALLVVGVGVLILLIPLRG